MSALSRAKAAFVFQYLLDNSFGQDGLNNYHSVSVSATTTYDDHCLDFVCEYERAFPGRKGDGTHKLAAARLSRLLKRLADDGWLRRWRQSNHDQYHPRDEPNWQYAYALPQDLINHLKTGHLTPASAAEKWGG